jgi:hypothetical protein
MKRSKVNGGLFHLKPPCTETCGHIYHPVEPSDRLARCRLWAFILVGTIDQILAFFRKLSLCIFRFFFVAKKKEIDTEIWKRTKEQVEGNGDRPTGSKLDH